MATEASLLPLNMSGLVGPPETSDILKSNPFLQELMNSPEEVQVALRTV